MNTAISELAIQIIIYKILITFHIFRFALLQYKICTAESFRFVSIFHSCKADSNRNKLIKVELQEMFRMI